MTALAADNPLIVEQQTLWSTRFDRGVENAVNCFQGAIICLDTATGFYSPGTTSTTLIAIGRCRVPADNTAGADGDINVTIDTGIFGPYANNGATISADDVGALCFIVDDQTVDLTDGTATRSVAGTVVEVTADGVFVGFSFPSAPQGT